MYGLFYADEYDWSPHRAVAVGFHSVEEAQRARRAYSGRDLVVHPIFDDRDCECDANDEYSDGEFSYTGEGE